MIKTRVLASITNHTWVLLSVMALLGLSAVFAFSALSVSAQEAPEITTAVHTTGHASTTEAAIGATVHANVEIASTTATTTPTGTVDFNRYTNTSCSGTPVVQVVALTNGEAESATTSVSASGLSYKVTYNGDANNAPGEGACIALTATAPDTSLTTTLSTSTVLVGASVYDSATLNNATANASGTVAYKVYTNNACSAGMQSAGVKAVSSGVVPDSDTLTFNTPGTFYWQAVYSGDSHNAAATSSCQSEVLQVLSTSTPAGRITVDKVTVPSGATTTFNFTGGGAAYENFSLTDVSTPNSQMLPPGNYSIFEESESGWVRNGATCSLNGATSTTYTPGSTIELEDDDMVECVFTNTQATSTPDDDDDNGNGNGDDDDDNDRPPFFKKFLPPGIWKNVFGDKDFSLPRGIEKSFDKVFKNWDHDDNNDDDNDDDDNDDDDDNRRIKSRVERTPR